MRFLMLGVFSIITLNFSCKKVSDYSQEADFIYINSTNRIVKLDYPKAKFSIAPGETHTIKKADVGPKTILPEVYNNPLPLFIAGEKRDELSSKIDDRCFKSTRTSDHSLINIRSYGVEKINDGYYKFTFIFTEADYLKSGNCQ